jgi:hypothetical protein
VSDAYRYNRMTIIDPEWGEVEVARPVPIDGNPWGDFAVLSETAVWELVNVVPGAAFADATRGYATPLMKVIGRPPEFCLRKLSRWQGYTRCSSSHCAMRTDKCVPGPETPLCFVPDADDAEKVEGVSEAAAVVIRLWVDGVYFIVVGPGEF